jgi:hypothetical protein
MVIGAAALHSIFYTGHFIGVALLAKPKLSAYYPGSFDGAAWAACLGKDRRWQKQFEPPSPGFGAPGGWGRANFRHPQNSMFNQRLRNFCLPLVLNPLY